MKKILSPAALFFAGLISLASPALAELAEPWQLGFQTPATPVMEQLDKGHHLLLIVITLITLFVLFVLIYICLRFNRKANPVPSRTAHNTRLEIIWTVIPIIILVAIAIPSLRLHYYMQRAAEPDMTLKVVGYQWYWHYEYPDQGGFGFDSYLQKGADLKPNDLRLLTVDNRLVVPVNTKIRVLVTGADVIHSWAVPAFGVKRDAIPGRLNETWFQAERTGTFYGQCSELCGVGHGFMPIVINVVSKEDFASWVKKQQATAGIKPAAAVEEAPLAKPESAKDKNPDARAQEEKEKSASEGEGKPAAPAARIRREEKETEDKEDDSKEEDTKEEPEE
jgi:cytochrome c oxidase subunit 2